MRYDHKRITERTEPAKFAPQTFGRTIAHFDMHPVRIAEKRPLLTRYTKSICQANRKRTRSTPTDRHSRPSNRPEAHRMTNGTRQPSTRSSTPQKVPQHHRSELPKIAPTSGPGPADPRQDQQDPPRPTDQPTG